MVSEGPNRRRGLLAWMALPLVAFYALLFLLLRNLPLYDDYDVGLGFADRLTALPVGRARWLFLAAAQQNEYKTYVGHAFVWAELAVLGHVDFRLLSIAGDLFVLLLIAVLWKLFLPAERDRSRRLLLFLPVPFLVFQLQYWETLNWPLPGLQNIPVLGFALGAIYLLGRGTRPAWWCAAAAMVLAIAASGNGFLVLPIGLLMLLLKRRWAGCVGWLLTGAASIWVYSYRYQTMTQKAGQGSIVTALLHPKVLYMAAFLGAAASTPVRVLAYPVGLALVGFIGWMIVRGYPRRNPVVCFCVLFVLLTAVGVAGIRSGGGLVQNTSSRYCMYSDLLLVFAWFAVVEEFLVRLPAPSRSWLYRVPLGLAVVFWLGNVWTGARSLEVRDQWMEHGMALYEHPGERTGADGPVYAPPQKDQAGWTEFEVNARRELDQSRAEKVYSPPVY